MYQKKTASSSCALSRVTRASRIVLLTALVLGQGLLQAEQETILETPAIQIPAPEKNKRGGLRGKAQPKNKQKKAAVGKKNAPANVKKTTPAPQKKQPQESKKDDGVKTKPVNKIAVLIYTNVPSSTGSESKEFEKAPDIVITTLDLDRPTIDGRKRTLDELVMDYLMYCEATYFYHMVIPEDAVDKFINSIREQNHLSDEQLRRLFREGGYTYEEGRQQLAMGQAIDALLNFKIRSRLIALESDVRDYYDAHPEYEDASYKIKRGFIPETLFTEEELQHSTDAMMKNSAIQWTTSYWLSEDEMTEERKEMLQGMKEHSYSKPEPVTGGYEVIRLQKIKPRALRSFEDRYREISTVLQEPQYYRLLDELKKELLEKYEVVYFT